MANKDRPAGFSVYGPTRSENEYEAGGIIYPGDAVWFESDGQVDAVAAGEQPFGVATSYASGAGETVNVADDPNQEYTVQADGSDINVQTDIGLNYNIVATTGDTTYRLSRQELDSSTGATDSNLPLRLVRIEKSIDNAFGAQVECIVTLNDTQKRGGVEGV
jgi:hypothetical protein